MKRIVLLAVFLLGSVGLVHAQEQANWTILHYTAVDNNLEGAAFNDYYEMQSTGSGDGVNIVTQFDRAEGFENRFGDWTDTRRFLIEQVPPLPELDIAGIREALVEYFVAQGADEAQIRAELETVDDATVTSYYENNNIGVTFEQTPVAELGEVDMGDPQALADFLIWGVQNYPANHYLVVIGSHGGGWRGIGPDDGEGESMLELPEIDQALTTAQEQLGIEKFDIIGFDACLMGVTDVAVMLEPHADYVLFSQEVIPSNGWEYFASIEAMKANPDWDAFQVGAGFVDNYMDYYAGKGARTKVDLSLVETAGLPNLLGALQNFADVVKTDAVELLSALGSARNNSQIFGSSVGDRADLYSYIDLKDFMTWFSVQTTITEAGFNAAQEVLAAYDGTVVYSRADNALPRATGLGIYLPSTPNFYDATYPEFAPSSMGFWQDYLNGFYTTISTELDGSALQLDIKDVFTIGEIGSSLDTPVVFFDAAGKGVVDLAYTISYVREDGTRVIVDTSPISYTSTLPTGETVIEYPNELTPSTFAWSVEFPYISDGQNKALALVQSTSSSGNEGTVQGTYVTAEGQQPGYLIFDTSTNKLVGVFAIADQSPYQVSPKPGEQFIVDLISLSPEGEVIVQPQTDVPLTFGIEPLTFSYSPAASGAYEINLSMKDLADNQIVKRVEVMINNDAVDGSIRGYTDTNEGVHFQYPYAWGESYTLQNDDGSISEVVSDDDGIQSLFVTSYADTEPQAAIEAVFAPIDAEIGEVTETTLGGQAVLSAPYQVALEDGGSVSGVVYALVHPESGAAIVFQLETVGDNELNTELATLLDNSLLLFAPV